MPMDDSMDHTKLCQTLAPLLNVNRKKQQQQQLQFCILLSLGFLVSRFSLLSVSCSNGHRFIMQIAQHRIQLTSVVVVVVVLGGAAAPGSLYYETRDKFNKILGM